MQVVKLNNPIMVNGKEVRKVKLEIFGSFKTHFKKAKKH